MFKKITAAVLICAALSMTVSANAKLINNNCYSWYFKPAPDNKQPDFDICLDDLKKYDAYAIGDDSDKEENNKRVRKWVVSRLVRQYAE